MRSIYTYSLLATLTVLLSCSTTKYLPEGDNLYTGSKVVVDDKNIPASKRKDIASSLEELTTPRTNKKIFGIPYKLMVYNSFGNPNKEKGLGNWIRRKLGEPPVLASKVNFENNIANLEASLSNNGYFSGRISFDSTLKDRQLSVTYTALPGVQYTIRKVVFPNDSLGIGVKLKRVRKKESVLKAGDPYNLETIKGERERIDGRLKERGYYFFSPDYILIKADSTVGENQVDLFVTIKTQTPDKALTPYRINNVFIYPNYSLEAAAADSIHRIDSTGQIIFVDDNHEIKQKVITRTLLFSPGDWYKRSDHNSTISRMVNIGTYKYVRNRFAEAPGADSPLLDVSYYLTLAKKKAIRLEVDGKTTSVNYSGTQMDLSWRNKNFLHGAELFKLKLYGGIDWQQSGQNQGFNIYRFGGEASLQWPRFFPVSLKESHMFTPTTTATLGYEWQRRQKLYTVNHFRASFGYQWKENIRKEHKLNIIDITYSHPTEVTDAYLEQIAKDSTLARVIENQLIFGPTYSYTYSNNSERVAHGMFYHGSVDLSAALFGSIQGANVKDGNQRLLFNVPYSQFIKTEQDFRYYWRFMKGMEWANRIDVGIGIPFGNSTVLPFVKQFFAGGSNGLRAFRARTVGPGTYRSALADSGFLPDQTGDIKLELSSEIRFPIYKLLKGAFFVDGGNVWLRNEDSLKPGAKFSGSFMKELAVGTGLGLRLDVTLFIVRFDLAMPIRKPWFPDGERWVFDEINLGDKFWRRQNLIMNIAIGYPF